MQCKLNNEKKKKKRKGRTRGRGRGGDRGRPGRVKQVRLVFPLSLQQDASRNHRSQTRSLPSTLTPQYQKINTEFMCRSECKTPPPIKHSQYLSVSRRSPSNSPTRPTVDRLDGSSGHEKDGSEHSNQGSTHDDTDSRSSAASNTLEFWENIISTVLLGGLMLQQTFVSFGLLWLV